MCSCLKNEFGIIDVDFNLGNPIWRTSKVNAKHDTFLCCGKWAAQSGPLVAVPVVTRDTGIDDVGRRERVMIEVKSALFSNSRIRDHNHPVDRGLVGSTWNQTCYRLGDGLERVYATRQSVAPISICELALSRSGIRTEIESHHLLERSILCADIRMTMGPSHSPRMDWREDLLMQWYRYRSRRCLCYWNQLRRLVRGLHIERPIATKSGRPCRQ